MLMMIPESLTSEPHENQFNLLLPRLFCISETLTLCVSSIMGKLRWEEGPSGQKTAVKNKDDCYVSTGHTIIREYVHSLWMRVWYRDSTSVGVLHGNPSTRCGAVAPPIKPPWSISNSRIGSFFTTDKVSDSWNIWVKMFQSISIYGFILRFIVNFRY